MQRLLPQVNTTALIWSIAGFVIISITLLACAAPDYATGQYVFATWLNETGWPGGIAWLLGLLQGGLGLTGFDAVAHMIGKKRVLKSDIALTQATEEIPNAALEGPRIMIYCQLIGISTGFIFLIVVLFASGGLANAHTIIESTAGPLLEIFYIATDNRVGAVCLLVFPLICFIFAGISVLTTASRMTFAFARDGGLPASPLWWKGEQDSEKRQAMSRLTQIRSTSDSRRTSECTAARLLHRYRLWLHLPWEQRGVQRHHRGFRNGTGRELRYSRCSQPVHASTQIA